MSEKQVSASFYCSKKITLTIPCAVSNNKIYYKGLFFTAHFEGGPNVPGFVQVEALAQTFLMTFLCVDEYKGMKTAFVSIDKTKFKRKIVPGDRLEIYATLDSFNRGVAKGYVESFVDGEAACSASLVVAIPDVINKYKPKAEHHDK